MTNTVSYTSSTTGKTRCAQFNKIESICSVTTPDIGQYYRLSITGIIYDDTQEFFDNGMLALKPDCSITYKGKIYCFDNFDKLCMVVENENNLAALETL